MQQKILMFRTITDDQDIQEKQVMKFINWGKGDVQQALNYYFINIEKGKIKKANKPQPFKTQQRNLSEVSKLAMKNNKKQESIKEKIEQVAEKRVSENSIVSQDQSNGNSKDAFEVLRKGSIQHKKTHDFIKQVREIYKLPIKGKPQQQLIKSSKSCLPEHEGKIPQQFMMVDCLSQALDSQHIEKMISKKNYQPENKIKEISNNDMKFQKQERTKSRLNLIQLSVSQSNQSEDSFRDIEEYEYRHVYSQSQAPPKITKINKQIQQEQIDQQYEQKEQKIKTKRSQPPKPTKQPKKTTRSTKNIKQTPQQQLTFVKKTNNQKQIVSENKLSKLEEQELHIGDYFVKGLCTETGRYELSYIGQRVEILTFIEEIKTKGKKSFGRNNQRTMNMRINFRGRQMGRIHHDEVRVIMPLIDQKLIRIQFYLQDIPIMADVFKPLTLRAKVFLLSKLITEPVVQNFQPQSNDKDQVHQISALFEKLSLPITTQPLIKAKSKYIKSQKQKKPSKYQSIDGVHLEQLKKQQQIRQQLEQKNQNQLTRIRNDPNYKIKQQSLKDMITKNQQNLNSRQIFIKDEGITEQGQVKKKVIEIDKQEEKDKLTELIELHEQNCQPYYPESNFKSVLYPYQAMALAWMLKRQGFLATEDNKQQLHPLWTQYQIKTSQKYTHLYFNELTGQVCIKKPTTILKCRGGILADEMGLGKTVMMTALIVSNPPTQQVNSNNGCTLVIVPLTLLSQWQAEINRHTEKQKVITYYSADRKKIANTLHNYNVVLSTYGTISHQYAQGYHTQKKGIYKYKWHRVILDEAHYIKGRIIQTSKAVYQLQSTYRWCLTGTPIQNTATDIFSLLHFIKYTPWSQFACWNRFIVKPLEEGDESIYNILRTILKQIFLRRTKNSKGSDGKPIIQLPPRVSKVELLTMSEKQRQFYDSIYKASKSDFDALIDKGILEAKYMQVLEILMRLRQICCHPILFKSVTKYTKNAQQFEVQLRKLIQKSQKKSTTASRTESQSEDEYYQPLIDADNHQTQIKATNSNISQEYFKQVIQKIASQNLQNCIICLEQPQDPVITCCLHIFCKGCNIRQIQEKGSCGFCRRVLGKDDFIYLPRQNRLNLKKGKDKQETFLSTKMIALNEHILQLKPDDKVVIFSQFLGMLDLLEQQIKKNRLRYVRMEGSNTHKQRTKIVRSFQQDPKVQIFLVSLKTAGVGLNLVAANKVFLMDPWWNPAVEEQAIERVHRIGQKRPVQIVRFIIDKTIETRMLQLNTQKKVLSQNILNQNQDTNNTKQKMEKLKYLMEKY